MMHRILPHNEKRIFSTFREIVDNNNTHSAWSASHFSKRTSLFQATPPNNK